MSTISKTMLAKVAAILAGIGLVAFSVMPGMTAHAQTTSTTTASLQAQIASLLAQIAALQAQLGLSQGAPTATFTRDLTIGSTGSDVTALQTWLISHGFTIPAGATGYFGTQTRAAVAAYQAANGIRPVAGYFGPITRSRINATVVVTTPPTTTPPSNNGSLSGGEADLNNYDLRPGTDLSEGDSDEEIALAEFDVDSGDVRVQRITVDLTPLSTDNDVSDQPWRYIDSLSVYNGSTRVGSVDAGSNSDWDEQDDDSDHPGSNDYYSIDIPVDTIIREGDMAELSIRADAQNTIDSTDQDQTFSISIPDDGIRAVDAVGIQQYTGDDGDTVTLAFNEAESGDLSIRLSADNPEAGVLVADENDTSDDFDVLRFEIRNRDNADVDLNSITIDADVANGSSNDITDIIRRATLTIDGDDYDGDINADNTIDFDDLDTTIDGDDTVDAVLTIQLFGQSGHYDATGETLRFSVDSDNLDAEGSDTGDTSDVGGTVTGETFSISTDAGISVGDTSNNAVLTYNSSTQSASYGTFTLRFDVTAEGDDVFIPRSATVDAQSSATAGVHLVNVADAFTGSATATLTSTADTDPSNSSFFVVRDGDTETFTAIVRLDPNATGFYQIGLDYVHFSSTDANLNNLQTLQIDENDNDFQTDPLSIPS